MYIKDWITLKNINAHAQSGLKFLQTNNLDLISLDFDSNDLFFVEALLKNQICPKLFIVEYNAKFPPPVKFTIQYNKDHVWTSDDYFGASLASFNELFVKYNYKLICCNSHSGANAFFIHKEFAHLFPETPDNINDIYVGPRYYLYSKYGHKQSIKTIESIFNDNDLKEEI